MEIDYEKVRRGKIEMLRRFMAAKKRAEDAGQVSYKKL